VLLLLALALTLAPKDYVTSYTQGTAPPSCVFEGLICCAASRFTLQNFNECIKYFVFKSMVELY